MLEQEFEDEVHSIVGPSGVPGSWFMEELAVKFSALIVAQKSTSDPSLLTHDMQVEI